MQIVWCKKQTLCKSEEEGDASIFFERQKKSLDCKETLHKKKTERTQKNNFTLIFWLQVFLCSQDENSRTLFGTANLAETFPMLVRGGPSIFLDQISSFTSSKAVSVARLRNTFAHRATKLTSAFISPRRAIERSSSSARSSMRAGCIACKA